MKVDKKQKVLITLIVIALAYVLWQVYSQFFRETPAPVTSVQRVSVPAPAATTAGPGQPVPATNITPVPNGTTPTPTPVSSTTTPGTVQTAPKNAIPTQGGFTLEAPVSDYQNQYIELVNQYQLLRMRRMIVDEEAGIAAAKERIAAIDQKLGRVGGEPSITPEVAIGDTANPTGYKLMYIDFQSGQWSATLGKEGRFLEVNAGDTLIDGTHVLHINQQGVVIQQDQNQYLLTFYGVKNLGEVKSVQLDETLAPGSLFTPTATSKIMTPISSKTSLTPVTRKVTQTKIVTPISTKKVPKVTTPVPTTMQLPPLGTPFNSSKTVSAIPKVNIPASQLPPPQVPIVEPAKPVVPLQQITPATQLPATPAPTSSVPSIPGTSSMIKPQPPLTPIQNSHLKLVQKAPIPVAPAPQPVTSAAPSAALKLTAEQKNTYNALQSMFNQKTGSAETTPEQMQQAIMPVSPLSFAKDEKYLLTVPKDYYVVQIMASRNLSDLTRTIRQYHLDDQARGFKIRNPDTNVYVLVYGVYKNNQDAATALAQLPPGVQQLKPWVRSIASIHTAINSNRVTQVRQVRRQSNSYDQGINI